LEALKISISGIRGIFGKDLTLRDVLKFSKNFSVLVSSKKCVIAADTRPSGRIIVETVKAGLMESGIDVYDLGVVPTPVAFRESRKYGAGLVVTSSHNPIEWNGLKMIIDGRGINNKQLDTVIKDQVTNKSKIGTEHYIKSDYINDAAKIIGKISGTPKVTVDVGGGAAKTVADSISVDVPSNGHLAVKNIKAYDGKCITVSDDEILSAQKELSSACGLFSEPAAATAYAGFLKQKSSLDSGETCVVLLTGNGLKDTNSAANNIILPEKAINSLDEIS